MEKKTARNQIDMTSGPILGKMLQFAFPLMCSSVLQLLFNAADVIVVGRFAGDHSLAAVGSVGSLVNLLVNLFLGVSVGVNVLTARYFGGRDRRRLEETVHTAMLFSIIGGVILTGIGLLFASPLLKLMDSPETVRPLAALYLCIYFLGMPAMMIYNFGSAILRAKGDTKRPLIFLSIAGVINVALNLVFVIVFKWDVAGVGAATALSQCVSAALVWNCLVHEQSGFRLIPRFMHINRDRMIGMLKIGLPAGLSGVLFSLSNMVIQTSINGFGDIAMAGNAAGGNLDGFVYVSMNAFNQAAISFSGQNAGARRFERIQPIARRAVGSAVVTGLILGSLVYVFGETLLGIYSRSPEVIEQGMIRLLYVCLPYFLCGIMDASVGIIRGLGYSLVPTVITLVGACGLRIIWLNTIFRIPRFHTLPVVFISYPISWAATALCLIGYFFFIWRRDFVPQMAAIRQRQEAEQAAAARLAAETAALKQEEPVEEAMAVKSAEQTAAVKPEEETAEVKMEEQAKAVKLAEQAAEVKQAEETEPETTEQAEEPAETKPEGKEA